MLEKEFQDKVFTFDYIAPKGESWRDVKIRAEDFIQDKIREKGLHVAFTHGVSEALSQGTNLQPNL